MALRAHRVTFAFSRVREGWHSALTVASDHSGFRITDHVPPRFDPLVSRRYSGLLRGLSSPGIPTASGQPRWMSALDEWRPRRLAAWPTAQPGCCWRVSLYHGFSPAPLALSARLLEAHASPTGHGHWEHKPRPPGEEGTEASSQGTGFPAAFPQELGPQWGEHCLPSTVYAVQEA